MRLPLPPEIAKLQYKGAWQPHPESAEHHRRTVYLFVKRNNRPPLLKAFDAPDTLVPCGQRTPSTHAGQALTLLNSPWISQQAKAFARRLHREAGREAVPLIQRAYHLALARPPRAEELRLATGFITANQGAFDERLADFCLVLFNLDEFLYVD